MLSWMVSRKRQLDLQDQFIRRDQDLSAIEQEMKRRALQRDIQDQRRLAATKGTVICIVSCGLSLASLGVTLTCVGLLSKRFRNNPAPWLVTGPTCILMGVMILLLSVETILKFRRANRATTARRLKGSKENLIDRKSGASGIKMADNSCTSGRSGDFGPGTSKCTISHQDPEWIVNDYYSTVRSNSRGVREDIV